MFRSYWPVFCCSFPNATGVFTVHTNLPTFPMALGYIGVILRCLQPRSLAKDRWTGVGPDILGDPKFWEQANPKRFHRWIFWVVITAVIRNWEALSLSFEICAGMRPSGSGDIWMGSLSYSGNACHAMHYLRLLMLGNQTFSLNSDLVFTRPWWTSCVGTTTFFVVYTNSVENSIVRCVVLTRHTPSLADGSQVCQNTGA